MTADLIIDSLILALKCLEALLKGRTQLYKTWTTAASCPTSCSLSREGKKEMGINCYQPRAAEGEWRQGEFRQAARLCRESVIQPRGEPSWKAEVDCSV